MSDRDRQRRSERQAAQRRRDVLSGNTGIQIGDGNVQTNHFDFTGYAEAMFPDDFTVDTPDYTGSSD